MTKKINILLNLHDKHIKNTPHSAFVTEKIVLLCDLTFTVQKKLNLPAKAYINTKVLKHLYDKKPAQQYDFIICNLYKIIRYPDRIYKNNDSKRGDYCFVKTVKGRLCFSSIEKNNNENIFIVTVYEISEKYLKNYTLLWSWEGGTPPS